MTIRRYEIYQAELPVVQGSHIQSGRRPVVIVSNDAANTYSPVVTVVPLTTKLAKKHLPTHVLILTSGLRAVSLALCEQLTSLDKARLTNYIGHISEPADCAALDRAMAVQLGLAAA